MSAITSYLESAKNIDLCPARPPLSFVSRKQVQNTLLFCLSIDSGARATKFSAKFIEDSVGQRTKSIMLLVEAHNISESCEYLARCFGEFGPEIRQLTTHGITADEEFYQVKFVFIGDFNIYYALIGISRANSKFPCL